MYSPRYTNIQFNIFHALVWSIGFHVLFITFSPSFKVEVPVKVEKVNEKVLLNITKKPQPNILKAKPVPMQPISPKSRKHFIEPEVSLVSVKVNLDRSIRTAHISKVYSKPLTQDVKIYKSKIKNTPTVGKEVLSANLIQNNFAFSKNSFHPKVVSKIPEKIFAHSVELVGSADQKKYYAISFTPRLRKIQKVAVLQQEPKIDFEKLWSEYSDSIRMKVASAKIYPEAARKKNQQGKAMLSLKLGRNGKVLDVFVGNSSGHDILDQAAIDAINDAAPYPAIPDKLDRQYVLLKLPISFILN